MQIADVIYLDRKDLQKSCEHKDIDNAEILDFRVDHKLFETASMVIFLSDGQARVLKSRYTARGIL